VCCVQCSVIIVTDNSTLISAFIITTTISIISLRNNNNSSKLIFLTVSCAVSNLWIFLLSVLNLCQELWWLYKSDFDESGIDVQCLCQISLTFERSKPLYWKPSDCLVVRPWFEILSPSWKYDRYWATRSKLAWWIFWSSGKMQINGLVVVWLGWVYSCLSSFLRYRMVSNPWIFNTNVVAVSLIVTVSALSADISRTFQESEVSNQKLRGDLYDKMVKIDRCAPTADEHVRQAVTKLRYMQVSTPLKSPHCMTADSV